MDYTYTGMFKLHPKKGSSVDGFVDHDKEVIKKSVLNIIKTHKGSRVYDPDYGTNLHRLIHEQNIARTRNIAKTEITDAVTKYEPRAIILSVSVFPSEEVVDEVIAVVTLLYVEFGDEETIEMKIAADNSWENEDKAMASPHQKMFGNSFN
jgi:phage baseplate assembly protein W